VLVAPEVPINVRVEASAGSFVWWVEAPDGTVLDGRQVQLRDGGGARVAVSKGRSKVDAQGLVSITDLESRVSAIVEVAP
jgi:hypothetical protein